MFGGFFCFVNLVFEFFIFPVPCNHKHYFSSYYAMFISNTNKYVGWQENSGRMTDAKISNTTGYFVEFISDHLEQNSKSN